MGYISWEDFEKIEICVGTIIQVDDFPEAKKPAYKIKADFGSRYGIKKTSAQVTDLYSKKDLVGKQIIGILNFPPKQIGPFVSDFLLTGFAQEGGVVLAIPDNKVSNGGTLS
ncbi:tRNA-binding protein [Candidatus Parcubacteria bacterium]|nr:MAG: tRNA-binding protein [Candidatus Parcubacteria bacterium]